MLTFCARCPALVERLLASGSARLEHLPGALRWLQKGPRLRPLLDGPAHALTGLLAFMPDYSGRASPPPPASSFALLDPQVARELS